MRYPSVKTIMDGLNVDRTAAQRIRGLLDGSGDYHTPSVVAHYQQHPRTLDRVQRTLMAVSDVLGAFGPESIEDKAEYVNVGETYQTTVLYDSGRGTYRITSYGDWVETYERSGRGTLA